MEIVEKTRSIKSGNSNIIEFNIVQKLEAKQLSPDSEVISDIRTNRAWRRISSEFEIAFRTVETRLTLRILKSSLTFVQITADTESNYDRKN